MAVCECRRTRGSACLFVRVLTGCMHFLAPGIDEEDGIEWDEDELERMLEEEGLGSRPSLPTSGGKESAGKQGEREETTAFSPTEKPSDEVDQLLKDLGMDMDELGLDEEDL